ncbi:MAG: hypothetical protein DCC57_12285 [Chloroflexi bacterium]|nr:MAG: hypothetical protein DCC57_12285 [Chloroflexota bacterium]
MRTRYPPSSSHPRVSRRQFLYAVGSVTAGAWLAGCGRWLRFGTDRDAPTPEPQEIHFLVRPDLREAFAIDDAVEAWNAESAQQVILEDLVGDALDAAQTVQSALAAGEQAWDGFAMIEAPWVIADWVERGLIQPLDDLILVSSVPDAEKVVAGIIPSVLAVTQYEGHQYLIPANLSSISLGWFWEPLEAAGVEPPQTWDEVRVAAARIKVAAPGWTPFDALWTPLADHISLVWSATNTPLTDDGLIDWTGEASLAALRWKQEMVAAELMPADHASSLDNWLRGDTAIMNLVDALGPIAQQIRGVGVSATGLPIRREKDDPKAGTPFWSYGCVVLKNAVNPQGMVDFYLRWFGPTNQTTGRYAATVAAKPAYQYTYDQFIVGDPDLQWQLDTLEIVRNSVPFPANRYWWLQNTIAASWIEKAVDARNPLSAEQAMQAARDEMQAAIDNLSA